MKKILIFFMISMMFFSTCICFAVEYNENNTLLAMETTPKVDKTIKIYDYANLFSQTEKDDLFNRALEFIDLYDMDIVIVTISQNNKKSSMEYADDFYDYNYFGRGLNNSGLLYLIDMDKRNMWISTTGDAISIYNDNRIDKILDYTYNKISNNDYYGSAVEFIENASYYAEKGAGGSDVIIKPVHILLGIFMVSISGTIIYIIIGITKHKNVKKQKFATYYITNSLDLKEKNDSFVRKYVNRTRKAESSSGGSSTHFGSSGSSHGGGGRSF